MKLTVIHPVTGDVESYMNSIKNYTQSLLCEEVELSYKGIASGYPFVESVLQGMVNGVEVVKSAQEAAKEGADGIFVNCFDDPGVLGAREVVDIPVYGAYEPALITALTVSEKIGIITTDEPGIFNEIRKARSLGLENRIHSIKAVDMQVSGIISDKGIGEKLAKTCIEMEEDHKIGCVILGCTGMQHAVMELREILAKKNSRVKIIEPLASGLTYVERMIKLEKTGL